jgi:hypothetical protein
MEGGDARAGAVTESATSGHCDPTQSFRTQRHLAVFGIFSPMRQGIVFAGRRCYAPPRSHDDVALSRRIDARFKRAERRTTSRFASIDARFDRMEATLETRFGRVDRKIESLGEQLDRIAGILDDKSGTRRGRSTSMSAVSPISSAPRKGKAAHRKGKAAHRVY